MSSASQPFFVWGARPRGVVFLEVIRGIYLWDNEVWCSLPAVQKAELSGRIFNVERMLPSEGGRRVSTAAINHTYKEDTGKRATGRCQFFVYVILSRRDDVTVFPVP